MSKFLIVYASLSGNTEEMALEIAAGIKEAGQPVEILEAYEADASKITFYKGILIGTYTWADGQLPDELLDFYEEMSQLDLSGIPAAVFGSFDWAYGDGGVAVDQIRETLLRQGAIIIVDDLKIELTPSPEEREQCRKFGKRFVERVAK